MAIDLWTKYLVEKKVFIYPGQVQCIYTYINDLSFLLPYTISIVASWSKIISRGKRNKSNRYNRMMRSDDVISKKSIDLNF